MTLDVNVIRQTRTERESVRKVTNQSLILLSLDTHTERRIHLIKQWTKESRRERERGQGNSVPKIEYVSFSCIHCVPIRLVSFSGGLNMLVCSICVRQAKHALFLLRVSLSFSLPYHLAALFAQLLLSFFFSHSLSYGLRPPTFSKKNPQRVREKEQINSTRRKENNQPCSLSLFSRPAIRTSESTCVRV